MYSALLGNASFHELLLAFDRDLAATARGSGCTVCGSRVHSASYQRKPRGLPLKLGPEHDQRFSFCCAIDGCRKRKMALSLRFLERKIFHAAIVVVVSIMQHGLTEPRLRRLTGIITVDRRTLKRWQAWWRSTFTASPFWRIARAAFMPSVDEERLPAALLARFAGSVTDRLIGLLRFVSPLSGRQVQAH